MRKWWSKRKYKGDELLNAKWNREDKCWYLHSQYIWHVERNAYLVRNFWEDKIFVDPDTGDCFDPNTEERIENLDEWVATCIK